MSRRDGRRAEAPDPALALAADEQWPAPGGLLGVVRRLFGRPQATGADEVTMRADTEMVARAVQAGGVPAEGPHPGLVGLARRSDRRLAMQRRSLERRLSSALGRHVDAQDALNRAEDERRHAAAQLQDQPGPAPRPLLGAALTRDIVLIPLLLVVMIPLEALLTYPQLLVLGMSDRMTMVFAALIGVSLIAVAEVIAFFLHHSITRVVDEDEQGVPAWQTPQYWMVTVVAVGTLATSAYTIHRLADAREANQGIVEQRELRLQQLEQEIAGAGAASGIGDDLADRGRIDLEWSFGLQFLVLLGAIGLGVRKRMAEDFNAVEKERRARQRRVRRAEMAMRRTGRRLTRAASRHEAVERQIRGAVERERALLLELFARVQARVPDMEARLIPDLMPVDDVVELIFRLRHEPIAQTVVGAVPVGQPPPAVAPQPVPTPEPPPAPQQPPAPPIDATLPMQSVSPNGHGPEPGPGPVEPDEESELVTFAPPATEVLEPVSEFDVEAVAADPEGDGRFRHRLAPRGPDAAERPFADAITRVYRAMGRE